MKEFWHKWIRLPGWSLPEGQPDGIEAHSLLAVDNGREVADLAEVPGVGIVGVQAIHHGGANFEAKPVEALQKTKGSWSRYY